MAKQNRSLIKTYFETGDIPTQSQFTDSFDSQVFWNDDVVTTLGTTDDKVPTEKAVSDAISAIPTPTLADVTTAGATTTDPITTGGVALSAGNEYVEIATNGQINVTPDTTSPSLKTTIQFTTPTGNNQYSIPDKGGATDTFAMLSDIGGGAVASVNGQTGVVVLTATDVDALKRDGSNANSDIDISSGGYMMNAASFHAKGTGGAGHLGLKHQSSGATASGSESALYADSSGNPQWKNASNAVDAVATSSLLGSIINALTGKTTLVDADMLPLADSAASNASKKVTFANFKISLQLTFDSVYQQILTAAVYGAKMLSYGAKTTPIDADSVAIVDSADSNKGKYTTFTNLKAYFKTYFDTIYTTTSAVATQITTALSGYATQAWVTSQGYITNVVTALGYTPENVANKSDSYTASSSTTYASTKAVVDGLATKQASLGFTAENVANKSDSYTASSSTTYATTKAIVDGLATKANLSQAAYTMLANNTNGTANMATTTFKAIAKQTYSGTITWTGTTAPSGTTQHSYSWQQVGNVVTFTLALIYGTAGSTLTQVVMALPSDMPSPIKPDGVTATSDIICMLVGQLATATTLSANQHRAALRIDASSTSAFQLVLASPAAGNFKTALISGTYLTA